MTKRLTIHYSGRVQGVGFRYTTCQVARRFAVAGYVQNLPDGRVKLVAEGQADEIDAFATAVTSELGQFIQDSTRDISEPSNRFGDPADPDTFTVKY